MRILRGFFLGAVALTMSAGVANADVVDLITFDAANLGNGKLMSDPATTVLTTTGTNGGIAFNPDGRALLTGDATPIISVDNGAILATVPSTLALTDITMSGAGVRPGVVVDGFVSYRGTYNGGNAAYGFLENGMRLGESGNVANDGHAFANSREVALLSDVYTVAAGFDAVTWGYQGGSDNGATDIAAYLFIDGGPGQLVDLAQGLGNAGTRITDTEVLTGSTVQFALVGTTSNGSHRTLFDDIQLSAHVVPVPEPSSLALLGLAGFGMFTRRRR